MVETEIIEIFKKKAPEENSTVILAFPDVGLVGLIAVKHMIKELDMEEIGYVSSDKFPPITVVHDKRPTHPIRIYEKDGIIVLTSEIPIGPNMINPFSNKISQWLEEIKAEKAIILGGLPNQNREEVEKPEIHGVPSIDEMENLLEEKNYHILEEGFITGINGVLLRNLRDVDFPTIYLMSESHLNYPDPDAAAVILEALNNIEEMDISVEELRKQEEEIKIAARDLMRQTQETMQNTAKAREEEMPIMYG